MRLNFQLEKVSDLRTNLEGNFPNYFFICHIFSIVRIFRFIRKESMISNFQLFEKKIIFYLLKVFIDSINSWIEKIQFLQFEKKIFLKLFPSLLKVSIKLKSRVNFRIEKIQFSCFEKKIFSSLLKVSIDSWIEKMQFLQFEKKFFLNYFLLFSKFL